MADAASADPMTDPYAAGRPVVEVVRRMRFCAANRLHSPHLSDAENAALFGPCNNPHGQGHNYTLWVTCRAPVDPRTGIVANLSDIKTVVQSAVIDRIDHRFINKDLPEFAELNPTLEHMLVLFWNWLQPGIGDTLVELRLEETENNFAVYRGQTV